MPTSRYGHQKLGLYQIDYQDFIGDVKNADRSAISGDNDLIITEIAIIAEISRVLFIFLYPSKKLNVRKADIDTGLIPLQ